MRTFVVSILVSLVTTTCFAQRAQRIMVGIQADLIKSDNDGLVEKVQGGLEGSFYASRKFAATTGVEWWSEEDRPIVLLGARLCPIDEAFVRLRWQVNNDVAIGAGFAKPLSENLRIEAMADYYFNGQIAIRGGMAYGIGRYP